METNTYIYRIIHFMRTNRGRRIKKNSYQICICVSESAKTISNRHDIDRYSSDAEKQRTDIRQKNSIQNNYIDRTNIYRN